MNITAKVRSALLRVFDVLKHPLQNFRSLSSNGKLAVFLSTLLVLTGIFSLLFVLNTSDEVRQEAATNDFDTQVSTLTPLNATLSRSEGNVFVKKVGGDWEKAEESTELTTEDEVKTEGAGSRAIIKFVNGSEARLDGDSHMRVDATAVEKIELYILRGRAYNRVQESSTPYSVESDDAHYEALGTVFVTEFSGDKQAVEVIESSIIETTTNNTIDEGNRYIVKSEVNPSDNKKVERIDINTYKTDPFIEWNLQIDTSSETYKDKLGFLSDTEAPDIEITSPKQDQVILTAASSETGAVEIKGRASGAVSVKIIAKSINGTPVTNATVQSDGTFTASAINSPLGLSVFEIEATDRVGNVATKSLRVTIQQKSAPVEDTDSDTSLLLLKSVDYKIEKDTVSLTWYISKKVNHSLVRVLYSKQNNPTLTNNDGVLTPTKGGEGPATTTNSFEAGGLDKTTYYFRICELNQNQNECVALSNSLSTLIK